MGGGELNDKELAVIYVAWILAQEGSVAETSALQGLGPGLSWGVRGLSLALAVRPLKEHRGNPDTGNAWG